jgi:hypothetical protein
MPSTNTAPPITARTGRNARSSEITGFRLFGGFRVLLISDLRRVLHAGNHTLAHLEIERAQRLAFREFLDALDRLDDG